MLTFLYAIGAARAVAVNRTCVRIRSIRAHNRFRLLGRTPTKRAQLMSTMETLDGAVLWTSVAVVYRECLLKRSGEQLPHVARRIDGFLDDQTPTSSLSEVYERTASLHCMRLLEERRPAVDPLYREWEFSNTAGQAARRGDLASLTWLAECYLPEGPLSAVANSAAASGKLLILKWLCEKHKGRVHWGGVEWCEAIRERQTDVIKWLQKNSTPEQDAVWRLAFDAADLGNFDLVQWLLKRNGSAASAALRGARKGHQWSIMKWLVTHCDTVPLTDCVEAAAKDGDLEFLKWLHTNGLAQSFSDAVPSSAASGHLDVLTWLYQDVGERQLTADCMDQAARAGHLEVVKWLDSHKCPATTVTMDGAATSGHLEVVQWLHEHRDEGCSVSAMNGAAENGHLAVLKWLYAMRDEGCGVSAMEKAAGNGHLEVVKWLHSHHSEGCTERAMDWAAKGGHLDVVAWLYENRSEGCTTAAMNWAAYGGHLETMKWLYKNQTVCTTKAMCLAAAGGHLNALKWLHETNGGDLTLDAVDMAAASGHLRVLKWLFANGAEVCSPSAMRDAVLGSHFPVMMFLYNNYSHEVCEEGVCSLREDWEDTKIPCIEMAQWLLEKFREELQGVTFSVNSADCATNKWMKDHNMHQVTVEDEFVFWECGQ